MSGFDTVSDLLPNTVQPTWGIYKPTWNVVANASALAASLDTPWFRIGNYVFVGGTYSWTAPAALSTVEATFPLATTLANSYESAGTGTCDNRQACAAEYSVTGSKNRFATVSGASGVVEIIYMYTVPD